MAALTVISPRPPGLVEDRTVGRALALGVGAAVALLVTYLAAVWVPLGQRVDTRLMTAAAEALAEPAWAELVLRLISPLSVLLAAAGISLVALVSRGPRTALVAGTVVVVTIVAAQVLKEVLPRPTLASPEMANSLPSGHVAAVAGLAAAAWLASSRALRPWAVWVGAIALLVTGSATVVMAWHRPSDVVAAVVLAVGVGAVGAAGLARISPPGRRPSGPRTA